MLQNPALSSYRREDLPRLRLVNLFAEQVATSRTQTALLPRPALETYLDLGPGPIRGMYGSPGALEGALFSVSASQLYRGATSLGLVAGIDRVSMAASATQLLIANDTDLYLTDGTTLSTVAFPDDAGVSSVAYINGYFLASRADTQRFYWSAILDGAVWDGLDYASAERGPDNIVAIWVVSDQIWIFGENTTEIWVPTGDSTTPFQRVDGRLFDKGCMSRDTIARFDNSVLWVGNDGIVYRGDTNPVRVSNHSVEEAIAASEPSDLRAFAFPWVGHIFYALATARGTHIFDAATQQWSEFASYGRDVWRAHLGVYLGDTVYAGDDELGRIWRLADQAFTDDELIVEARWTTVIAQQGFCDNLLVDMSVGEELSPAVEPIVECRISRDGGNTFSDYRRATIGKMGQYRKRAVFRRFGVIDTDGMLFEFRLTDPTFRRVSSIRINEGMSGRGRPG
jgi:hypothetical protein